MTTPCHIVVEGNPVILYASRNGTPEKVTKILKRFLETFADERETAGEFTDTPECLAAQIIVRFGFEICEDDFSNLKVGLRFYPDIPYIYLINQKFEISLWQPEDGYNRDPSIGLQGCRQLESTL